MAPVAPPPRSVAVVAPIGPNPAALTELVWALTRCRGLRVAVVYVVLESDQAEAYWAEEIAPPSAAWAQLRAVVGDAVPPFADLVVTKARRPCGGPLPDAAAPGLAVAVREAVWAAVLGAQSLGHPVIVALSGGRWRASTALATTAFQLLARPGDQLVDVRISTDVASGGTGFFFPEQLDVVLYGVGRHRGVPFRPSDVEVVLDDVRVPLLRPLLAPAVLARFETALAASDRAIAAAAGPRIVLDLAAGQLQVHDLKVALSPSFFALYAVLADAARAGQPWVGTQDHGRLGAPLQRWRAHYQGSGRGFGFTDIRAKTLDLLSRGQPIPEEDRNLLAQLFSKLRRRMETLLPAADPLMLRAVPRRRERGRATETGRVAWAIDLPPGRITLTL